MEACALTDTGQKRSMNQDFIYASKKPIGSLENLFIVADGMGGHKAGDFASRYAVAAMTESIGCSDETNPVKLLRSAIEQANREIIEKFRTLRSQIDYGIFLPIQYAAIAALTGPDDFIEEQRQQYEARNRALCGGLRKIGWNVPDSQGTMFVWAKIPEGYESSADFCIRLMERTGVIVTPGSAFGSEGEGYVRMALVVDEQMIAEIIQVLDESDRKSVV